MPKLENLAGQVILQALKAKVSKRSVGESIDKIEKISPLGNRHFPHFKRFLHFLF